MQAEMPNSEIQKVSAAAASSVSHTRCASPDVTAATEMISKGVLTSISNTVKDTTKQIVKEAYAETPHETIHVHTTLMEMTKMADEKLRKSIMIIACCVLIAMVEALCYLFSYESREAYCGQEYMSLIRSERAMLSKDVYYISVVPSYYSKNPKLAREKIKRNKDTIKQRKLEASTNKGKFSTNIPLER